MVSLYLCFVKIYSYKTTKSKNPLNKKYILNVYVTKIGLFLVPRYQKLLNYYFKCNNLKHFLTISYIVNNKTIIVFFSNKNVLL